MPSAPIHAHSLKRAGALLVVALAVFIAALITGTSGVGIPQLLDVLGGAPDEAARSVLLEVRLPRLLAAFSVGGLLAVAGVLLQALFRNPLADPYVLARWWR
jgi:iron complex transport system permease protein